jgi:hypothetical protein
MISLHRHTTKLSALALFIAGLSIGNSSQAATLQIYDSEETFLSSTPIVSTETFDEFPSPTFFFEPQVEIDKVLYKTDNPFEPEFPGNPVWTVGIGAGPSVTNPNDFGSNFIGNHQISFGENQFVNAFGFFIGTGGIFPTPNYEISVRETNGITSVISLTVINDVAYRGFVSTTGISSITVRDPDSSIAVSNWSYDNVSRGEIQSTASVTEQSYFGGLLTFGILGTGFALKGKLKQKLQK